jgi:hypothetical protein
LETAKAKEQNYEIEQTQMKLSFNSSPNAAARHELLLNKPEFTLNFVVGIVYSATVKRCNDQSELGS